MFIIIRMAIIELQKGRQSDFDLSLRTKINHPPKYSHFNCSPFHYCWLNIYISDAFVVYPVYLSNKLPNKQSTS